MRLVRSQVIGRASGEGVVEGDDIRRRLPDVHERRAPGEEHAEKGPAGEALRENDGEGLAPDSGVTGLVAEILRVTLRGGEHEEGVQNWDTTHGCKKVEEAECDGQARCIR